MTTAPPPAIATVAEVEAMLRHGSLDARHGLPPGWVHVPGQRLTVTARAVGVPAYPCLVGWGGTRRYPRPILDGVAVRETDAPRLRAALAARDARRQTPEQRARAAERRARAQEEAEEERAEEMATEIMRRWPGCPPEEAARIGARACVTGSGRVGRSTTAEDPALAAVIAWIRHRYTDYDDLLTTGEWMDREERAMAREEARAAVGGEIAEVLRRWESPAPPAAPAQESAARPTGAESPAPAPSTATPGAGPALLEARA